METQKSEIKSLTDFQVIETYKRLYEQNQQKPTLTFLDKSLRDAFGISTTRNRLVSITHAIESAAIAQITSMSDELKSSLEISILKFTNEAVDTRTKALKESMQSMKNEITDSAKQIDEREQKIETLKTELSNEHTRSVGLIQTLEVRDKQISSLQAQLDAKEAAAANVYAQQITQKIEENLKLQGELESLKQRFIDELTVLAGETKANAFATSTATPQTSALS